MERVASIPVSGDKVPDVCVIEVCIVNRAIQLPVIVLLLQLGGTIGDIEGMPFVEAFRQFQFKVDNKNFCNVHVSLVPEVSHTPFFHI